MYLGRRLAWQVVLGIINLVFTLIALAKVDTWGRRPLLIRGMALVALSMLATAGLYYWKAPSIWVVVHALRYMACEALSICAVIWVLTAEIFPNRVRGRAVSIAIFANWGTNWLSAMLFPWYVKTFRPCHRILDVRRDLFRSDAVLLAIRAGNQRQEPGRNRPTLAGVGWALARLTVHATIAPLGKGALSTISSHLLLRSCLQG